ncbi:GrpB family protein [Thalassotalea ganghwensis]
MAKRIIEVVAYNPQWPRLFELEKALLSDIIGEFATKIEHIGSTSVEGLAAKPIIDILVEVPNLALLDAKASEFEALGYEVKGENGIAGRRYYQKGGNARSHHIHAFVSGTEDLHRHRAFKAYLIAHKEIAQEYAKIKKQAALQCAHDNDVYIALKNGFIAEHEPKAICWFNQ